MDIGKRILELKKLTAKKDLNFLDAANYFLDHLAENPVTLEKSRIYKEDKEFFEALFVPILKSQGDHVKLISLMLMSIEQHHFIHGMGQFSNCKMAMLYYYKDIHLGLVSVSQLGQSKVDFYRLSGVMTLKDIADRIVPLSVNKTKH